MASVAPVRLLTTSHSRRPRAIMADARDPQRIRDGGNHAWPTANSITVRWLCRRVAVGYVSLPAASSGFSSASPTSQEHTPTRRSWAPWLRSAVVGAMLKHRHSVRPPCGLSKWLVFDAPMVTSMDFGPLALSASAATAVFRFQEGMLETLVARRFGGTGSFSRRQSAERTNQ